MRSLRLLSLVFVTVAVAVVDAQAGLVVSGLAFNNSAIVVAQGQVWQDESNWYDVVNPLQVAQSNHLGDTYSNAQYSLNWTDDSGQFHIQANQTILYPNASLVTVRAEGGIEFTTSVSTLVSFRVHYAYSLPNIFSQAVVAAFVGDDQKNNYAEIAFVSNPNLDPPVGTIDQTRQALLPAGGNYGFGFRIRLDGSGSAVAATDNSFVEMTLTPVPEPATLFPLAVGAADLLRRRRREVGWRRSIDGSASARPTEDETGDVE